MLIARVLERKQKHSADIQLSESGEIYRAVRMAGRVYWNVQKNDLVLIGFIAGDRSDPIILDRIILPSNEIILKSAVDDIHLIHELKTTDDDGKETVTGRIEVQTDKDGNLILNLSGVKGNMAINLTGEEGKMTLISKGDIAIETENNISVKTKGDAKIESDGETSIKATGNVKVESADNVVVEAVKLIELGDNLKKVLINNLPVCIVTGAPHAVGNKQVKA